MTQTPTQLKLIALVNQVLPEPLDINESSRFVEDLGFDSLKSIMLATLVDQGFELNLEVRMGELLKLTTIVDACRFIDNTRSAQSTVVL